MPARSFSIGWRPSQACAGSMSDAAMGLFHEFIVERCGPAGVEGIDPSDGQLAFALTRPAARGCAIQACAQWRCPFRIRASTLPQWRSDLFRARPREGALRDGAGGPARWYDRGLCVGYVRRRISARTDPGRATRHGNRAAQAAERRGLADGKPPRPVGAEQARPTSKRGSSRCGAPSRASRSSGRLRCSPARAQSSRRCQPTTLRNSESACESV